MNVCSRIVAEADRPADQIVVNATLPFAQAVDVLIHEYAHALDYAKYDTEEEDHGPIWGVRYSQCCCVMIQWDREWKANERR